MKSAEQVVLESIDELLCSQDDSLVLPMTKLDKAVSDIVVKHAKTVATFQDKILRAASRHTTKAVDQLDGVYTRLLQGLDAWQYDMHFLLQQLAAKGGVIKVGDPLETALIEEATRAPELLYGGTLVLSVKEAVGHLDDLIEVLREIRDRMPPRALRLRGEPPSLDAGEDVSLNVWIGREGEQEDEK